VAKRAGIQNIAQSTWITAVEIGKFVVVISSANGFSPLSGEPNVADVAEVR
jgi:hypothetical protein